MHPDWQTEINRYCETNSSPESGLLSDLVRYTWLNTINPRQLSGHLQGRFLAFLSKLIRPDRIIEVGTFTGYATLCLAEGLSSKGELHTIEADSETAFKAREQVKKSPYASQITIHTGDAAHLLQDWKMIADLIFVDANKQYYPDYLNLCLPLLSERGILLFDNTLWSGKVLDENARATDADTKKMHAFNQILVNNADLEVLLLPLRDGLSLVRKK